jgi:hypothetical protein
MVLLKSIGQSVLATAVANGLQDQPVMATTFPANIY